MILLVLSTVTGWGHYLISNIPPKRLATPKTLSRRNGLDSLSFEINDDPEAQNILTGVGYAYGLALTLRLFARAACQKQSFTFLFARAVPGNSLPEVGLIFEAPVCSTWVWMNRPVALRDPA